MRLSGMTKLGSKAFSPLLNQGYELAPYLGF